jgi:hypothetical protein
MAYPEPILDRLQTFSAELGVSLTIVQFWENEFRPGWCFRFHGVVHNSKLLLLEIAGTMAVELSPGRSDEVDLFLFVNGKRVGLKTAPFQYLTRIGSGSLSWDDVDPAYEQFDSLDWLPWKLARPAES